MTAETDATQSGSHKASKLPLLIGIILACIGGGGGYYAMMPKTVSPAEDHQEAAHAASADPHSSGHEATTDLSTAFVVIDPLVISLPGAGRRDHLRFSAQLQVVPEFAAEVEAIKPRIVDVLNGYLRAVDIAMLEDPTSLMRLRAQMLRRIQVVTGEGRVEDLLIMEFVLS